MTIPAEDFKYLCDLIRARSGISLNEEKNYLIDSRLLPVARKHDLPGIKELIGKIRTGDKELTTEIIEALTTNETSFFRDIRPFDQFRDIVLPNTLEHNKDGTMRVWCAACSTGQEPYSLVMTFLEKQAAMGNMKMELVGTDIDTQVLKRSTDGIYTQFEVQRGLPITLLMKYFAQEKEGGDKWKIKDELKSMVKFQYLNLMEAYDGMGQFDAIFCRNVLIYFEPEVKTAILEKLAKCLKPHGILYLGSSETISGLTDKLQIFNDNRGLYCRP